MNNKRQHHKHLQNREKKTAYVATMKEKLNTTTGESDDMREKAGVGKCRGQPSRLVVVVDSSHLDHGKYLKVSQQCMSSRRLDTVHDGQVQMECKKE